MSVRFVVQTGYVGEVATFSLPIHAKHPAKLVLANSVELDQNAQNEKLYQTTLSDMILVNRSENPYKQMMEPSEIHDGRTGHKGNTF